MNKNTYFFVYIIIAWTSLAFIPRFFFSAAKLFNCFSFLTPHFCFRISFAILHSPRTWHSLVIFIFLWIYSRVLTFDSTVRRQSGWRRRQRRRSRRRGRRTNNNVQLARALACVFVCFFATIRIICVIPSFCLLFYLTLLATLEKNYSIIGGTHTHHAERDTRHSRIRHTDTHTHIHMYTCSPQRRFWRRRQRQRLRGRQRVCLCNAISSLSQSMCACVCVHLRWATTKKSPLIRN